MPETAHRGTSELVCVQIAQHDIVNAVQILTDAYVTHFIQHLQRIEPRICPNLVCLCYKERGEAMSELSVGTWK